MSEKYYYRARVQYDGSGYKGFQWQEGMPTIQGELLRALREVAGDSSSLRGASRTDAGVHALGQVVRLVTAEELDPEKGLLLLNESLPRQIRVRDIRKSEKSFVFSQEVVSKEYRYFFTTTPGEDGSQRRFIANHPYAFDAVLVRRCLEYLKGEQNFQNFASVGEHGRSSLRRIISCELELTDPREVLGANELFPISDEITSCYQLRIEGDGFLKHMIRNLIAALWKVGSGRLAEEEFEALLLGKERVRPGWKLASPKGLFLYQVRFDRV